MIDLNNKPDRELLAIEALILIDQNINSERYAINKIANSYSIVDWRIRSALHALVFETIRYKNTIDFIISSIMKKGDIKHIKNDFLKNTLRLGIYEIKFLNKAPKLVSNTLVEITKNTISLNASKFINAILHESDKYDLENELNKFKGINYLSLKYSHPKWYIKYLKSYFPEDFVIRLLQKNNEHLPVTIRINESVSNKEEIISELETEGFQFKLYPRIPDMIEIQDSSKPVVQTKSYKNDLIYIQSKASIVVSHVLNPQSGELIYDLTAAPGSKTMHIAQLMGNRGKIIAFDRSFRRIKEIKDNLRNYNKNIINLINYDSKYLGETIQKKSDKAIVDPPCSGTGTFSRRPISKWNEHNKNLKLITSIQWNLLENAIKVVKKGGFLVYSTCSITLEENEKLIKKLIKNYPNVKLVDQDPFVGCKGLLNLDKTQRFYPHLHDTEGFFIAKLQIL
ncbi:MAG: hypothetical protein EU547_03015 [Promethearchaeota archaeon]|nr:MAG: hypothetical protein EU547_03015 [Candidatus Lokiarchaeota archaeon]